MRFGTLDTERNDERHISSSIESIFTSVEEFFRLYCLCLLGLTIVNLEFLDRERDVVGRTSSHDLNWLELLDDFSIFATQYNLIITLQRSNAT